MLNISKINRQELVEIFKKSSVPARITSIIKDKHVNDEVVNSCIYSNIHVIAKHLNIRDLFDCEYNVVSPIINKSYAVIKTEDNKYTTNLISEVFDNYVFIENNNKIVFYTVLENYTNIIVIDNGNIIEFPHIVNDIDIKTNLHIDSPEIIEYYKNDIFVDLDLDFSNISEYETTYDYEVFLDRLGRVRQNDFREVTGFMTVADVKKNRFRLLESLAKSDIPSNINEELNGIMTDDEFMEVVYKHIVLIYKYCNIMEISTQIVTPFDENGKAVLRVFTHYDNHFIGEVLTDKYGNIYKK